MFARQNTRVRKAEQVAGQAWDQLVSVVDHAGSATRSATHSARQHADEVSARLGSASQEARRRAGRAYDALAGRTPPSRWSRLAGAALIGIVLGWIAATFGREIVARSDQRALERSVGVLPEPDRSPTR
jgi:hypothetical protein